MTKNTNFIELYESVKQEVTPTGGNPCFLFSMLTKTQ